MTNKVRGTMTLEVGENTYELRLSTNALCELEEKMGKSIDALGVLLQDPNVGKLKLVRLIVWAALNDRQPGMSLDQAGDIIDEVGHDKIMVVLNDLMSLTMPAPKKKGSVAPPPRR